MDTAPSLRTRPSLLACVRKRSDNTDWTEFLELYYPLIAGWCRAWDRTAQEADVNDLVAEVLLKLFQRMKTFEYDPGRRFRGWLRVVTESVCSDVWRQRRRQRETCATDCEPGDPLESVEAREDLESRLAETFDLELREMAVARVRLRVKPKNWEAFELRTSGGLSPDEVAKRLGIPRHEVDVAKCRVIKLLRDEIGKLRKLRDDDLLSEPPAD